MTRRDRDYVAVPRSVLERRLSGTEAAVWVLVARNRRHTLGEDETWPSRAWLMTELGRPGRQADVVSRATTRLQRLGLLGKRVGRRHGRTTTFYRLPARDGEAYVHAEHQLLAWLRQDYLTPEQLLALLRWRDACGSAGHTDDTVAEFARRYGDAVRTVRRHRNALVQLGLLRAEERPGMPTVTRVPDEWTLRDLLAAGPPADVAAAQQAAAAAGDQASNEAGAGRPPRGAARAVDNASRPPRDPGQIRRTTPAKSAAAPRPETPHRPGQIRHTERAPDERAPGDRAPDDRVLNPSSASVRVRARKAT